MIEYDLEDNQQAEWMCLCVSGRGLSKAWEQLLKNVKDLLPNVSETGQLVFLFFEGKIMKNSY